MQAQTIMENRGSTLDGIFVPKPNAEKGKIVCGKWKETRNGPPAPARERKSHSGLDALVALRPVIRYYLYEPSALDKRLE